MINEDIKFAAQNGFYVIKNVIIYWNTYRLICVTIVTIVITTPRYYYTSAS